MPTAETRQRHVQHGVSQAMRAASEILAANMTVGEALRHVSLSTLRGWPVVDQRGVVGVVSLARLKCEYEEGGAEQPLRELMEPHSFPHVHMDQPLDLALERMGTAGLELLPVVSRADMNKLEGIITLNDLLDSFGLSPAARSSDLATKASAR